MKPIRRLVAGAALANKLSIALALALGAGCAGSLPASGVRLDFYPESKTFFYYIDGALANKLGGPPPETVAAMLKSEMEKRNICQSGFTVLGGPYGGHGRSQYTGKCK